MTPEEKAHSLTKNWRCPHGHEIQLHFCEECVAQAIREAKIEAYEEAAQIVEQAVLTSGIRPKFPIRGGGPYTAIRVQVGHSKAQLAASIRALRDSLVETVPS